MNIIDLVMLSFAWSWVIAVVALPTLMAVFTKNEYALQVWIGNLLCAVVYLAFGLWAIIPWMICLMAALHPVLETSD